MTERQMWLKEHFLEPETRCDTFISAEKKAAWKVQLDLLEQIIGICKRHGIEVSLAGGSLLGAVRHQGYIPWDDDVDVMMFRRDYERFLEIAPHELKYPLALRNQLNDPATLHVFSQVMNVETSSVLPQWARDHIYASQGICVDVFPLDKITDNDLRLRRAYQVKSLIYSLRHRAFMFKRNSAKDWAKYFIAQSLYHLIGNARLHRVQERVFWDDSSSLVGMSSSTWGFDRIARWTYPIDYFTEIEEVPFEYLQVPIWKNAERFLTWTYGNWREFVKGAAEHSESFHLRADISYKELLAREYGMVKDRFVI